MHITSTQIKKSPELWMSAVWFDDSQNIMLNATGVDEDSSRGALTMMLLDFRNYIGVKVQEALEELK